MSRNSLFQRTESVSKNRVRFTFLFILIITVLAGLIIWPQAPGWFGKFRIHLGLDLQGGTHLVYQADVSQFAGEEKKEAVEGVRDVIERRVNAYGVSEPTVQTNYSGDNYRIIVELAGVKDVNEAIKMIGETPLLEFKVQGQAPVEDNLEANNEILKQANEVLVKALAGEDFAALAQQYSQDTVSAQQGGELGWAKRGLFVPEFEKAIFDDLKVGEISKELVTSQFGYHIIKKLDERIAEDGQMEVSSAHILLKNQNADLNANWENTALSGRQLERSNLEFDPQTNRPLVALSFNDEGKNLFAQITEANVGKPVAIFLDGNLISAPTVQEAIKEGRAVITGNFNVQEAKDMVRRLNSGALPVPIELISQQTIGSTLGNQAINKSLLASIIGLALSVLFMIIYYRLPGVIAILALSVYAIINLAIVELVPITLTLAGIAGFVLSVAMAVDANVLIFERMKEELREGKSLATAVEVGFNRAWSSIWDSNVSSIITCIILAWFSTSIVKGFAITLAIGIVTSMFSAITVTRTLMRLIVTKSLEKRLGWFGIKKNPDN